MKDVKVLRNFKDLKENKNRKVNEIFKATQERIEEINSTRYGDLVAEVVIGIDLSNGNDATVINGQVVDGEVDAEDVEENEVNIEDLTVAQIKELLDQMAIEYNSKMKKDELIALIEEGD